jgi:hypothetical protein
LTSVRGARRLCISCERGIHPPTQGIRPRRHPKHRGCLAATRPRTSTTPSL